MKGCPQASLGLTIQRGQL